MVLDSLTLLLFTIMSAVWGPKNKEIARQALPSQSQNRRSFEIRQARVLDSMQRVGGYTDLRPGWRLQIRERVRHRHWQRNGGPAVSVPQHLPTCCCSRGCWWWWCCWCCWSLEVIWVSVFLGWLLIIKCSIGGKVISITHPDRGKGSPSDWTLSRSF